MSIEPTEVTLTSRREQRAGAAAVDAKLDGRFWNVALAKDKEPCPDVHSKVIPWAEKLWGAWRRLRQRDREHDLIYENRQLKTGGKFHPGVRALEMAGFDTSELFVTTSIVDTFDARFSKRKTMPMFVVDDAEWELKQQAEDFKRWLHGKLKQADFEKIYGECVTDMLVRGDGVAYIDDGDGDVFAERIHRSELLVDPYEARYGADAVRTMYRYRTISRDSLIARFPEYEAQILAAPDAPDREDASHSDWLANEALIGTRDVVDFVEVWHLPHRTCGPDEDGGGRVAGCLVNATLFYEEWKAPRFPFARLTFNKPQRGFWGRGIVEKLRSTQASINRMVADIAINVAVTGKGIWMVPEQANIPLEKLTGYRPFKLTFAGPRPPEFVHPVPVSAVTLDLLRQKIAWAYEMTGAAQWAAQGKSPGGADASGVALDTLDDLYSDRHSKPEESCSMFRLDSAQRFLDAAARVAARLEDEEYEDEPENDNEEPDEDEDDDEGMEDESAAHEAAEPAGHEEAEAEAPKKTRKRPYYSTWLDKGRIERLDWNQVAMTEEQYRLQLEPVSFLPSSRSGKLATTAQLIKTGVLRQDQALNLYDEPDIDHVTRNELALQRNNERIMGILGNPKKPMPSPEEWHDLEGALLLCKQYYNRAQSEGAPAEVETRYREYGSMVVTVQDMVEKAKAERAARNAPPPPPPAPGMDPMAGGAPPGGPMPPMDPAAAGMPPMPGAPPMAA